MKTNLKLIVGSGVLAILVGLVLYNKVNQRTQAGNDRREQVDKKGISQSQAAPRLSALGARKDNEGRDSSPEEQAARLLSKLLSISENPNKTDRLVELGQFIRDLGADRFPELMHSLPVGFDREVYAILMQGWIDQAPEGALDFIVQGGGDRVYMSGSVRVTEHRTRRWIDMLVESWPAGDVVGLEDRLLAAIRDNREGLGESLLKQIDEGRDFRAISTSAIAGGREDEVAKVKVLEAVSGAFGKLARIAYINGDDQTTFRILENVPANDIEGVVGAEGGSLVEILGRLGPPPNTGLPGANDHRNDPEEVENVLVDVRDWLGGIGAGHVRREVASVAASYLYGRLGYEQTIEWVDQLGDDASRSGAVRGLHERWDTALNRVTHLISDESGVDILLEDHPTKGHQMRESRERFQSWLENLPPELLADLPLDN